MPLARIDIRRDASVELVRVVSEAVYRAMVEVADEIHAKGGVPKEDVWINLVETSREDWSFGNGEMQYGPK